VEVLDSVDGPLVFSSGYKHFLSTGSAVFRERSQFLEYFEPSLDPWREYVPFERRKFDTDCEIVALLAAARENDPLFRGIGERSKAFAASHFTKHRRSAYWSMLLSRMQPFYDRGSGRLDPDVAARLLPFKLMMPFNDGASGTSAASYALLDVVM
jgi:hypothetical protein